jgi:hypothetical protein
MSTRIAPAALAVFLMASAASADPLPISEPQKVGLSGEGLARLTTTLKSEVDQNRSCTTRASCSCPILSASICRSWQTASSVW